MIHKFSIILLSSIFAVNAYGADHTPHHTEKQSTETSHKGDCCDDHKEHHHEHHHDHIIQHKTLTLKNPVFRALKGAKNGSAYLEITQNAGNDDVLLSASAGTFSKTVEIHDHIKDPETGAKKMVEVPFLTIPGTESDCSWWNCWYKEKKVHPICLMKGGKHIMLMDIDSSLVNQESILITLTFKNAGPVSVEFKKESINTCDHPCDCAHHQH